MTRRLLFRREFLEYTGGHGKVFDYFRHASAHPRWQAVVHLTDTSTREQNPWVDFPQQCVGNYVHHEADALFVAGMDWVAYPRDLPGKPVINLIQHVRHATPDHPLRQHLRRRAIRICVSQAVADAILATGDVHGPVQVIEAALDVERSEVAGKEAGHVVIDAIKQPELGRDVAGALQGSAAVSLIERRIPRSEYLRQLAEADIAILLPHSTEGFYLPALEAMALGCATIVPDCVGNRAYARDHVNALMPRLDRSAILSAFDTLVNCAALREALRAEGGRTARGFTQYDERRVFHQLLDQVDALWSAL